MSIQRTRQRTLNTYWVMNSLRDIQSKSHMNAYREILINIHECHEFLILIYLVNMSYYA